MNQDLFNSSLGKRIFGKKYRFQQYSSTTPHYPPSYELKDTPVLELVILYRVDENPK